MQQHILAHARCQIGVDHPQITVTPHNASITDPRSVVRQVAENIRRFDAGEPPLYLVDRATGY
jgi:glyoxylate/hydroxypyruvate reductase A